MLDLQLDKASKLLVLEIDESEAGISDQLIGGEYAETEMTQQI